MLQKFEICCRFLIEMPKRGKTLQGEACVNITFLRKMNRENKSEEVLQESSWQRRVSVTAIRGSLKFIQGRLCFIPSQTWPDTVHCCSQTGWTRKTCTDRLDITKMKVSALLWDHSTEQLCKLIQKLMLRASKPSCWLAHFLLWIHASTPESYSRIKENPESCC